MDDLYQQIIMDHYNHPHHQCAGDLDGAKRIHAQNASCGDTLEIQVSVVDGMVVDLCWRGQGCAISQATMSIVSDYCIGKPIEEVRALDKATILSLVGLTEISSSREKCLFLGWSALRSV